MIFGISFPSQLGVQISTPTKSFFSFLANMDFWIYAFDKQASEYLVHNESIVWSHKNILIYENMHSSFLTWAFLI